MHFNQRDIAGQWQGLLYIEDAIPQLPITPNFCGIGYGDINQDNYPDLLFSDYQNDLESRLLIFNPATGKYEDKTLDRTVSNFVEVTFGSHAETADMNGNGLNDLFVVNSLGGYNMKLAYNSPENPGFFPAQDIDIVHEGSNYFVATGDLNNDGMLDFVEVDDGSDVYFLNQGNGPEGHAMFQAFEFPNSANFGSNTVIADLNKDSWNDVLIADMDVDFPSCTSNRLKIQRNVGNAPNVSFVEDPGNLPTGIGGGGPLGATHGVAVTDINGDT